MGLFVFFPKKNPVSGKFNHKNCDKTNKEYQKTQFLYWLRGFTICCWTQQWFGGLLQCLLLVCTRSIIRNMSFTLLSITHSVVSDFSIKFV